MGALVADGAHQLAAAVLEHRRADMRADGEVEAAQVLLVVAVDREAAQLDDAAAVLELVGDVVEQFVERGQVEVLARDLRPVHAAQALQRRVEFVDAIGRQVANPARRILDVLAMPGGGTGEGVRLLADYTIADHGPRCSTGNRLAHTPAGEKNS